MRVRAAIDDGARAVTTHRVRELEARLGEALAHTAKLEARLARLTMREAPRARELVALMLLRAEREGVEVVLADWRASEAAVATIERRELEAAEREREKVRALYVVDRSHSTLGRHRRGGAA